MIEEEKKRVAIYRKIAIDITKNIVNGKYAEGEKLFGRSVLASQYKVSPETIRKAVYLLKDVGILDTEKGSGVEVKSVEKAKQFVELNKEIENITIVKNEIEKWSQKHIKEVTDVIKKIEFIVDSTNRLKSSSNLIPFEINITKECTCIGKTIENIQFWHNTGGTIVAILRDNNLIVSPGPYAEVNENDVFYIIGNEEAYLLAKKILC